MKSLTKVGVFTALALLVVSFQNCGNNTNFSATGELVEKADNVALVDVPNGEIIPDTGDGSPASPPGTAPPPVAIDTDDHRHDGHNHDRNEHDDQACDRRQGHDHDHDRDHDDDHGQVSEQDDHDKSSLSNVCVLQGNGSSVKIGLIGKDLNGQVGTPRDVCMSENACTNILAKKFKVKGSEKRGFCNGKNPKVVLMTDAEIESSLAQTELLKQLQLSK